MFDDVRRLYKKYEGHSRIGVALAPGIIWDNTDDGYREMRKMADEMHIPLTMHVLESEDDDKYCREVREEGPYPIWNAWDLSDLILLRCTVSAWKRRTLTSSNSMM